MTTIDAHAHLISPEAIAAITEALPSHAPAFEYRDSGRFLRYPSGRESGPLPRGMTDVEVRLADMDRTGVDVQLLSPSPPQFGSGLPPADAALHARIVNDATVATAEQAPDWLRVLLTLPLQDVDAALLELARLGDHPLVHGVELPATAGASTLDAAEFGPLWAELERRRCIVLIHPAPGPAPHYARHFLRNLVGNPTDTTVAIASVIFGGVLERYSRLRICFVHGGGFAPYQIGRWDRGWELREELRTTLPRPPSEYLRRCYFDSLTHDLAALRFLGQRVGWDRVVLGSDYCFDMSSDDPVQAVRSLELDQKTEAAILGNTLSGLIDAGTPTATSTRTDT